MVDQSLPHPALDEAFVRRKTLHDALVHLEQAISSPAVGRIAEWTEKVRAELAHVDTAFQKHRSLTERADGLYQEVLERAPRLTNSVERLRDEHPSIQDSLEAMAIRLESVEVGSDDWPIEQARDDLGRSIGVLIRHRQKGADLVWEAYNVDIGGHE
jgi:hypothetical protein